MYIDHVLFSHFSGDYISALSTRDSPRLASAYLQGDGCSPQNFNRENLKFGLKFSVLGSITSGLVGVSACIQLLELGGGGKKS